MKIAIVSRIVLPLGIALGSSLLAKPLLAQCQTGVVTATTAWVSAIEVDGSRLAVARHLGYSRWVEVFAHAGGEWMLEAVVPLPDGDSRFNGPCLALDGDVLAVGAPDDPVDGIEWAGKVFIHRWTGSNWTLEQVLESDMPSMALEFGGALALEGDTLVVGELNDMSWAQGRVHVYLGTEGTWTREAVLMASDGHDPDFFGYQVALRGDTLIVGADFPIGPGKVYVFEGSGSVWTETQRLFAADPIVDGAFGVRLSFDGTTLAIGAASSAEVDGHCVYTFVEQAGQWIQEARLTVLAPEPIFWPGSVKLSGDRLLVGEGYDSDAGPEAGSVIVFERTGGIWSQAEKLYADDTSAGNHFGLLVGWAGGPAITFGSTLVAPSVRERRLYSFAFDDPNCPKATFTASPAIGLAPLPVSFTDQSTGIATSWEWSFGDGASATEQHPSHTYAETGGYTVDLIARGPSGSSREIAVDAILVAGTAASASVRNGSGVNDLCYASTGLPLLGETWTAEVDASAHAGASLTFLLAYLRPRAPLPTPRGEILIDLASPRIVGVTAVPDPAGIGRYTLPIPSDLALEGFALATQAGIFGSIELCNAVDLVLGF